MDVWEVDYAMQMLYIACCFNEHGRLNDLLKALGPSVDLDPYDVSEFSQAAIAEIFQNTKCFYHGGCYDRAKNYIEGKEILVLRDPVLSRYDKLCREYEEKAGITPVENPYARDLESAVHQAMRHISSYCYDYRWFDGTMDKKGPKLVLMLDDEFVPFYDIPESLFSILDFCEERMAELEQTLSQCEGAVIPFPAREEQEKEAA